MPSPACEVRDGSGSFVSTTNGVNVTPGNSVTIRLASPADVWSIACITTDETSSAATVNASLVVDSLLKTATFTAPAAGKAYRFQSTINGGNANGVPRKDYTTTFCVYTLATSGARAHALDETFESSSIWGWLSDLNDLLRNAVAVVSNVLTLASTTIRHIGEPKSDQRDIQITSITTTDATATDLFTFATTAGRSYYLSGFIEGTTSSLSGRWLYRVEQYYDNVLGTLTARISSPTGGITELHETSSALTLVADANSGNIRVRISTGLAATTIRWRGRLFLHEGLP